VSDSAGSVVSNHPAAKFPACSSPFALTASDYLSTHCQVMGRTNVVRTVTPDVSDRPLFNRVALRLHSRRPSVRIPVRIPGANCSRSQPIKKI